MMKMLPRHIAVIMDGNGRWAQKKHLPRIAGHKAGKKAVKRLVRDCVARKIDILTLFAFSSENWKRPAPEVSFIMKLFAGVLTREVNELHEQNIQLNIIGDRTSLDETLRKLIFKAEQLTKNNTGLKLIVAVNYGGRWDIAQAVRQIAIEVEKGHLSSEAISLDSIQSRIALSSLPDPDLLIRTSGERRISNFLLWQLAYTEIYFTDTYWPDFDAQELDGALNFFASRKRRFGALLEPAV